jgi:mannose-6-phosphate isomerase-like protein (cupin superfamily)
VDRSRSTLRIGAVHDRPWPRYDPGHETAVGRAADGEWPVDAFELSEIAAERARHGRLYLEFLRKPDVSAGLYVLAAGTDDPQQPHTEDEVYHVVRGRARIRVADEERPVGPGSVVYVAAGVPHHFHTIEDDLEILVVFAPAQHTRRPPG